MTKICHSKKHIDRNTFLLMLSVSAVIAYGYFGRVDWPNFESRLELHTQIVTGTALSPYRYRILVPFTLEVFTKALSAILPANVAFLASYAIYDLMAILFLLAMLFLWLSTWFTREQALIGVLFIAGTMPIALQDHYFQPWSLLEAGIFSAALVAMHRNHYCILIFLVAVASLNRETAFFIPLQFLLTIDFRGLLNTRSEKDLKPLLLFGGLLLTWVAVYWGLRYLLGSASHIETIEGLLARNTTEVSLACTFVNTSLFLGILWVFALLGYQYAPHFIRRIALIIPFYMITVLVWGVWQEVRLLMVLYPVLVPLGLSFLYLREPKIVAT